MCEGLRKVFAEKPVALMTRFSIFVWACLHMKLQAVSLHNIEVMDCLQT